MFGLGNPGSMDLPPAMKVAQRSQDGFTVV